MKLQLAYPTNVVLISQTFGANSAFYSQAKYGGIKGHNGLDLIAQHGYPVYATHDGFASFQIDAGGGHGVVIITDKEYEDVNGKSSYFKSLYWHLCDGLEEPKFASPLQGKTGFTKVSTGDLIGYADNTGASTGNHLHFGLKVVEKGEDWGTWLTVNSDNGYGGAIDPMPYFNGVDASQILPNLEKKISLLQKLISLWQQLKAK